MTHRAVTVLDLDGSLPVERLGPARVVDLRDVRGVRYACEADTLASLRERLRDVPLDAVLLGSGDHHHLALLALERHAEPFTLALFDHHADLGPAELLTCGSWVEHALRLPNLREVVLVGIDPDTLAGVTAPLDRVRQLDPSEVATVAGPVHVSVDKDVLHPDDATTGWSHGDLRLDVLLAALRALAPRTIGFDVCGEAVHHPLDALTPAGRDATERNLRANVAILDALRRA